MNTNIAQPIHPDRSQPASSSEPHDFNMEAVIANNFGQGDDHQPTDPMRGSPLAVQLRAAVAS